MRTPVAALLGKERKLRGGEIITRLLAEEGVETVFGIIDGTYFGLYSTFRDHGIRLVTPRHESSALHMAGAYARLTGRLGVAIASNGPGVANALPGVAVENAEGNRVLLVTSCRRHGIVYPDRGGTFQYFPQTAVIRPMAKWSEAVPSVERLPELTRAALRACFSGRPGVVHLDVPEDIMNGTFEVRPGWFREPGTSRPHAPLVPHPDLVARAARLLAGARRPLIHVGSGVIHAGCSEAVRALAARLGAAVTTSWAARAAVDERWPGVVPMPYVAAVNEARRTADVVLVLGSRLGETDWWGKPPYWGDPSEQRLVHVDIEASVLGNTRPADVAIQADVAELLRALSAALGDRAGDLAPRRAWLQKLDAARAARRAELDAHLAKRDVPMHPAHVAATCRRVLDDDAILVVDGGNTAIWANFFWEVRAPGTVVTTPKMGMLGAGCSQAVAAKVARPEAQVVAITGDGAMGFHPQEVETAVRNELPVTWIVLCDRQWGMVKMNQQFALRPLKTLVTKALPKEETINADLGEIAFDELARAMGAHGERVADPDGLEGALRRALASGRPAVIHVDVDPVAHMWAPNLKDFKDMHEEPGK